MKLKKDDSCVCMEEYKCSLTEKLDDWAGLSGKDHFHLFRHYIFIDETLKEEKYLLIRVPGGTTGSIHYDGNNIITNITIDTDYVIETYPDNINELVKEFIGEEIELQET